MAVIYGYHRGVMQGYDIRIVEKGKGVKILQKEILIRRSFQLEF